MQQVLQERASCDNAERRLANAGLKRNERDENEDALSTGKGSLTGGPPLGTS